METQKTLNEPKKLLEVPKYKDDKDLNIYLKPVEKSLVTLPTTNFDGYIIYEIRKGHYNLVKVKNFKDIYTYGDETTFLEKAEGKLNGKPFFIVKNGIAISVNTEVKSKLKDEEDNNYKDGIDLCYNPEAFYTMLQYVTLSNLKVPKTNLTEGLSKWFNENLLYVVIIVIAFIFFTVTPIGRELLQNFIEGF